MPLGVLGVEVHFQLRGYSCVKQPWTSLLDEPKPTEAAGHPVAAQTLPELQDTCGLNKGG